MPQKPNKTFRFVMTALLVLACIGIGVAVLTNTSRPAPSTPAPNTPGSTAANQPASTPAPGDQPKQTPAPDQAAPAPSTTPQTPTVSPAPAGPAPKYTAQPFPAAAPYALIGSLDPASGYEMQITVSPFGAGMESLALTNEYTSIKNTAHEVLQRFHVNVAAPKTGIAPFGVVGIEIDGVNVPLGTSGKANESLWRETAPGAFEAMIVDDTGAPAFRVTRRYELEQGSHDVIVRQGVENLRGTEATIRWYQFGPVDLPTGSTRLQLDKRRLRFGYLNSPQIDPSRQIVDASRFLIDRHKILGKPEVDSGTGLHRWKGTREWPNADSTSRELTLSWVGMTSRHYCVVMHALVDPSATNADKSLKLAANVNSYPLPGYQKDGSDASLTVALESEKFTVGAGKTLNLDTGVFAGPQSHKFMSAQAEPRAAAVNLKRIVVYTLGGPCGFCTFQSLTSLLYWFLNVLHDYIVFDYSLGIIVLVFCMRFILHPVTRHAQISMQRFGKQMQAMAPKQKKIQEKYANDPQKMREEMARLMREEQIPYGSAAKGCITPFLQTPVWIALYAMLFFMYELRHTPAFFGVFQGISQSLFGVRWAFLADLSEPDHFIPFGTSFKIPFLSDWFLGDIDGLNILPLLLGVVFYIQQKYMTPPSSTPLTPEQQQQQKMMKIITVVMFPLFMYSQPSGLTLYFVVNSTLGIIESKLIRKHAEKHDLLSPRKRPTRPDGRNVPRKPGFFARLQAMAEEKQRELDKRRKDQEKGKGGKR